MNLYDFEARDFALSEKGIHLLRSRFNYETIQYEKIQKATIKRGVEISNVMVALVLGIILLVFALIIIVYIISLFENPNVDVMYIELIVLPIIPGVVGIYLIYVAIKKGPILLIQTGDKKQKLRMSDFIKSNKSLEVTNYLNQKLSYKLVIQDPI